MKTHQIVINSMREEPNDWLLDTHHVINESLRFKIWTANGFFCCFNESGTGKWGFIGAFKVYRAYKRLCSVKAQGKRYKNAISSVN